MNSKYIAKYLLMQYKTLCNNFFSITICDIYQIFYRQQFGLFFISLVIGTFLKKEQKKKPKISQ